MKLKNTTFLVNWWEIKIIKKLIQICKKPINLTFLTLDLHENFFNFFLILKRGREETSSCLYFQGKTLYAFSQITYSFMSRAGRWLAWPPVKNIPWEGSVSISSPHSSGACARAHIHSVLFTYSRKKESVTDWPVVINTISAIPH